MTVLTKDQRIPTDTVRALQAKMSESMDNGAQLGWLLLPDTHKGYGYPPDQPVEELQAIGLLKGHPLLSGFTLELSDIWELGF